MMRGLCEIRELARTMFHDSSVFKPVIDYCLAAVMLVVPATLLLAAC